MGRLIRRSALIVATLVLALGSVVPTLAAEPASFGRPSATSTYGRGITFEQPVVIGEAVDRVEVLLTVADAIGPEVVVVDDAQVVGATTFSYTLDTAGPAHLIPNTRVVAQWRLIGPDDRATLGPEVSVVYDDDRFDWRTVAGDLVRVHWYKGDAAFAAKALKLGEDEVRDTSELLGVTETEPVDFFVYADVDDFYGALGPGAHENVAGTAYAEIRTLLGLIPPSQIDDPLVAVRIPHEFVHLVFDTASSNPYHRPPRWLNEGLAVYQSEAYGPSDRAQVEDAARSGTLIPLDGLTGQFPDGRDFFLAYAESVGAVDFMVRTYGPDALVTLIRSYADGRTDDEAFSAALGLDMTAFGAAWFEALGASEPTRYGPVAAPAGPVPASWVGGTGQSGAPVTPAPDTVEIPGASPATEPRPGEASDGSDWSGPVLMIALIVVIGLGVLFVRRRSLSAARR